MRLPNQNAYAGGDWRPVLLFASRQCARLRCQQRCAKRLCLSRRHSGLDPERPIPRTSALFTPASPTGNGLFRYVCRAALLPHAAPAFVTPKRSGKRWGTLAAGQYTRAQATTGDPKQAVLSRKRQDLQGGGYDFRIRSHDLQAGGHDLLPGSHNLRAGGRDFLPGSHDFFAESHDAPCRTHGG